MNIFIYFGVYFLIIFQLRYRHCNVQGNESVTFEASYEDEDDDNDNDNDGLGDNDSSFDDDVRVYKNPRNLPSTHCPRDEERTIVLNQKCLRKCSSDEDCKSKKKKCLCDGSCGMSCIKPDRECPELKQPEMGAVITTGRLFSDKATYTCPHGYHVVGLQVRSCQADGQWSGSPPSCKQNIYCLTPPTIDHARHNALAEQTTFDLDSTLQYFCQSGYVTDGFPKAKCLAVDGQASWFGPDITCEPKSCGPPFQLENGFHTGECFTFGCKVNFHCNNGYELVGKDESFCQANGLWTLKELPTCILISAVQCPVPDSPKNGKAIYTTLSYNSIVSYECKYGYSLVGDNTRRCRADQKWSGSMSSCKEINCGHPGRLWNGWLENLEGGTGLGASIIFRCNEGMKLIGNSSTVCTSDGKWRYPLPYCLAPCVVPQVLHGQVKPNSIVSQTNSTWKSVLVPHNEVVHIICENTYEFTSDGPSFVTCINGTWSQIPKCHPGSCQYLPKSPKNGMAIAPKLSHGMKAKFTCRDGFVLKGDQFVTCFFGSWVGHTPHCQDVFCSFPGNIDHGKILLVGNMGLYDYRSYVRKISNNKQIMYDCDKGYVIADGPNGATCIGSKWRPEQLPKCVPGSHPRLRWNKRRRRKRNIDDRINMNSVDFKRRSIKLIRKPNQNQYCESFITDSGFETVESVEVIKTNDNHTRNNFTFSSGTIVKVTCRTGHKLNLDNAIVKCVKSKWRPTTPQCLPNSCTLPVILNGHYLNGYRAGLIISNGSTISYQCEKLIPETIECQFGQLYPSDPLCPQDDAYLNENFDEFGYRLKKKCKLIEKYQNAIVETRDHSDNEITDFGEITYRCKGAANLSWKMKCIDGQWSGKPLKCDNNKKYANQQCVFRNNEPNVLTFYNDEPIDNKIIQLPHLAQIVSRCRDIGKFLFTGSNNRQCLNGEWSGQKPSCFGLNQENEYAIEKSPTILFSFESANGLLTQSHDGKLIVYPGTIVYLDCLWNRRFGNPKWIVNHNYRKYPEKWAIGTNSVESELKYRLVIDHASVDDTGRFTCLTPANHSHLIDVVVKAIHCPQIINEGNKMILDTEDTKLGTTVKVSCRSNTTGHQKARYLKCLPSGNWSVPLPICELKYCPHLTLRNTSFARSQLQVKVPSTHVGSKITFFCRHGYKISGPSFIICLDNQEWSLPLPTCEQIMCDKPQGLLNGYIKSKGPFKVDDMILYNCKINFMMEGSPIAICRHDGTWSLPKPKCLPACPYPGTVQNGQMSPVQFYYKIGHNVTFTCNEPYQLIGAKMLKCLPHGQWSSSLPNCSMLF